MIYEFLVCSLHERIAGKAPEALQDFVQTRLTTSPPIVLSTDLFATGYQPAHVALDEPLCPPANQADDCTESQGDLATIACLCAQMHLLVEKEAHLAQDPDGLQSELMDTVNQGLERLYSQLQRECMALHPDLQLHESMHVSGMSQMFPVVTERLQLQADPPAKNQVTPQPSSPLSMKCAPFCEAFCIHATGVTSPLRTGHIQGVPHTHFTSTSVSGHGAAAAGRPSCRQS